MRTSQLRRFGQWSRFGQFRRFVCATIVVSVAWNASSSNQSLSAAEPFAPTASGSPLAVSTVLDVSATDVDAAKKRIASLGSVAKLTMEGDKLVEIVITEGSQLTPSDFDLFGKLTDLRKFQVLNCRALNTEIAAKLNSLKQLKSLALTNTVIDDVAVENIVKSFPALIELDLSSNANMSSQILKPISEMTQLQQLLLVQNRINEIGTRRLTKLQELKVVDLRGNMEAGDMTMEVLAALPKLKALKHRSTAVSDYGMELLSKNTTIENMLIQDFAITGQSGQHLAKLSKLSQLEIIRCQGFGNDGVLALKGMNLQRLTLRDLPVVDDSSMEVFKELPKLRRLYIHEISGITDSGLENLAGAPTLELLDIWSVPGMTDASMGVIAALPNLKELSIRSTSVSDAAIDAILKMPKLESLTFKENGSVTEAGLKKLASKKWKKLDIGSDKSSDE
jgi:Leucine-rich repeat (LRR) protein